MRVELLGYYGSDLMVANCARTSLDRQHEAFTEGDARLIRFLAECATPTGSEITQPTHWHSHYTQHRLMIFD